MKTLFKVLAGLVVLVVVAVVVLVLNLGSGIKAVVERVGPEFVQADVQLDQVDLSLRTGEGSLKGLVIGNPAGFRSDNAFSLGEIALAIQPESVTTDTIVINKLHVIAPEITYETGQRGSNLEQLQRNVEAAVQRYTGDSSQAAPVEEEGAEKKLIIRDLQVTNGQIHYSNPLLSKTVDLALPAIKLSGIGEKSGGATAVEVVNLLLASINKEAINAIAQKGLLEGAAKDAIEQGKGKLQESLGGFKGLLKKE